jgi:hypothetical protein
MGGTFGTPREENFLWAAVDAFVQNEVTAQELAGMLDASMEDLGALRMDFDSVAEKQPPQVREACGDIILTVRCDFDEYTFLLKKMKDCAEQSDRGGLLSLREKETGLATRLDRKLFEFRQAGLVALGPTRVPGINLILATSRKILDGHGNASLLKEQVHREKTMVGALLSMPPGRGEDLLDPKMRELYDRYLAILSCFDDYSSVNSAGRLEGLMTELTETGMDLGRASMASDPRSLAGEGPTSSPLANCVINAARDVRDRFMELPVLARCLTDLTRQFHAMKAYFGALSRDVSGSALAGEGMKIMEEDFELFGEALNDYGVIVEKADFSTLAEAEETLISVLENMKGTMDMFAEIARKENSVTCVRCSQENLLGERSCEKCGALLPVPAGQEEPADGVAGQGAPEQGGTGQTVMMGEHVQELFSQAQGVAEGRVSREAFKGTLARLEALLREARGQAGQLPEIPSEGLKIVEKTQAEQAREFLGRVRELYIQGLKNFEEGLSLMAQCARNGESQAMPEAIKLVWMGATRLQQVQEATRPVNEQKQG